MGCGCTRKRRISSESFSSSISTKPNEIEKKRRVWKKILLWSAATLFGLMFLAFILIWVVIPVSFMLSIAFQTFMVFIPVESPRNPNYNQPEAHGISGAYNFYITTQDYHNKDTITSIGIWLILPENDINTTTTNNITDIIRKTNYDILIYLHGVYCTRAKPIEQYRVLRDHFLILAIDHRGYGDSGQNVQQTELGIVHDHIQIYNWIKSINPTKNVYYWGHSLGTGLSTHTLRMLKEQQGVEPTGLILESPFTSFQDVVLHIFLTKIFSWLAYFNATIVSPLDYNNFHFNSAINIRSANCPIMIIHAEDDEVVPYFLGEKLARITAENRVVGQGNVTFHGFAAGYGFGHNDCTNHPEIPRFIEEFKTICRNFSNLAM